MYVQYFSIILCVYMYNKFFWYLYIIAKLDAYDLMHKLFLNIHNYLYSIYAFVIVRFPMYCVYLYT